MNISNWNQVEAPLEGEERWLRRLSDACWLSCLHRLTGFGHWEWETAFCENLPVEGRPRTWKDRTCEIVLGDRREEFNDMTLEQVREWYAKNAATNKNSMETLLDALKERAGGSK